MDKPESVLKKRMLLNYYLAKIFDREDVQEALVKLFDVEQPQAEASPQVVKKETREDLSKMSPLQYKNYKIDRFKKIREATEEPAKEVVPEKVEEVVSTT